MESTTGSISNIAGPSDLTPELQVYLRDLLVQETSPNTKRAYEQSIAYFGCWWAAHYNDGTDVSIPISVSTIIDFIRDHDPEHPISPEVCTRLNLYWREIESSERIEPAWSTLKQRLAVISRMHTFRGLDSPVQNAAVKKAMDAIKRRYSRKRKLSKPTPDLELKDLKMIEQFLNAEIKSPITGVRLRAIRDLAILLSAFSSGGRRRSEIAGMRIDDLKPQPKGGFLWRLGITKSDQGGDDKWVPIKGSAASALKDWIAVAEITEGYVFRKIMKSGKVLGSGLSSGSLYEIIKKRFSALQLSNLSPHSIRAGFVTETGRRNINPKEAMEMSLHASYESFMRYYRPAAASSNPAASIYDDESDASED